MSVTTGPVDRARSESDVSWRRRLLTDVELFLVVLAIGLVLGLLAAAL